MEQLGILPSGFREREAIHSFAKSGFLDYQNYRRLDHEYENGMLSPTSICGIIIYKVMKVFIMFIIITLLRQKGDDLVVARGETTQGYGVSIS